MDSQSLKFPHGLLQQLRAVLRGRPWCWSVSVPWHVILAWEKVVSSIACEAVLKTHDPAAKTLDSFNSKIKTIYIAIAM